MERLPIELLENIFIYFDGIDLCRCSLVCKRWKIVISNDRLWKMVCLRNGIREEHDLSLELAECGGLWKTYYRLYIERCRNWKNNWCIKHKKGGDSWFFQGWSSYQGKCLLPTYTDNTVDVFQVTKKALELNQRIEIPIPGLEPTFLLTNIKCIAAAKSNITLLYRKTSEGYKLEKLYACKSGSIECFNGNPEDPESLSSFINSTYRKCGMVRVIEFKNDIIWLCDYNSGRLFVVKGTEFKWFTIDSVTFFKTGSGYVCFWTNKCLSLCNIDGENVFTLNDAGIDLMSFNEQYLGVKLTQHNIVETWNIKKNQSLTTIDACLDTSLTVHKDSIFLLQLQRCALMCHDIVTGDIRWKVPYKLPGPPRAALFTCQLYVILNKFLLVFPSHRYGNQAAKFTAVDIRTGEFFYTSKFTGIVVDISDRLLVTLSSRKDNVETGNQIYIRDYSQNTI